MSRRPVARPRQAVILAGGRGERLRPYTDVTPKHMLPFSGRPFLSYMLEQFANAGFERVLLLLGYLPDATIDYCGNGSRWGLSIDYSITPAEWQTTLRLKQVYPQLDPLFLLHYCDNYWPMRWAPLWRNYLEHGAQAQMTVYDNADRYSRDNIRTDARGMVDRYDKSRLVPGLRGVDIGYLLMRREMIGEMPAVDAPFEQVLYPELCRRRMLAAYRTGHRYYGVGSLERYRASEAFFAGQRAVLLDRDGVLNERAPVGEYITSWKQWRWLPGALDALRILREAGRKVIVITNQAGIARGKLTAAKLDEIHARMLEEARRAGGEIDAVYHCPHRWPEAGEAGCGCRKPEPGMLFAAQRDHHLDLTRTIFFGDDERDAQAAENAGCEFAMVDEHWTLLERVRELELPRRAAARASRTEESRWHAAY